MTRGCFRCCIAYARLHYALFRYTRTHRDTVSALVMPSATVKHLSDSFFHRGGHFFVNDLIIPWGSAGPSLRKRRGTFPAKLARQMRASLQSPSESSPVSPSWRPDRAVSRQLRDE